MMVILWTCGDVFKTLYFFFRQAPIQFWICGSIQVGVDVLILLQVYIYKGNTDLQRKPSYRGDWVVIIQCNHEKSDHSQELEINCDIKTIQLEYFSKNCKQFNDNCNERNDDIGDWTSTTSSDNSNNTTNQNQNDKRKKNSINGNVQQVTAEIHNCNVINKDHFINNEGDCNTINSIVNLQDGDAFDKNKRLFSNKKPSKHKVSMLIHRHTLWRFKFLI